MTAQIAKPTAKLVALTVPVLKDIKDLPDEFVPYVARVSNPSNQTNLETSAKLMSYLIDAKHWSPLEMSNAVLEVNVTRDIARQLLRHRSMNFQEFSQRYADVSALGDAFVLSEARLQDTKNRQNSLTEGVTEELSSWWNKVQLEHIENTERIYKEALEKGIAKEVARKVLPEGLTNSRLYVNGNLRSWFHYCDLRGGNGTQKEHMDLANACWEELTSYFPSLNNYAKA